MFMAVILLTPSLVCSIWLIWRSGALDGLLNGKHSTESDREFARTNKAAPIRAQAQMTPSSGQETKRG
jgi:hypothetical protein